MAAPRLLCPQLGGRQHGKDVKSGRDSPLCCLVKLSLRVGRMTDESQGCGAARTTSIWYAAQPHVMCRPFQVILLLLIHCYHYFHCVDHRKNVVRFQRFRYPETAKPTSSALQSEAKEEEEGRATSRDNQQDMGSILRAEIQQSNSHSPFRILSHQTHPRPLETPTNRPK